jgi:hypothetical protein
MQVIFYKYMKIFHFCNEKAAAAWGAGFSLRGTRGK